MIFTVTLSIFMTFLTSATCPGRENRASELTFWFPATRGTLAVLPSSSSPSLSSLSLSPALLTAGSSSGGDRHCLRGSGQVRAGVDSPTLKHGSEGTLASPSLSPSHSSSAPWHPTSTTTPTSSSTRASSSRLGQLGVDIPEEILCKGNKVQVKGRHSKGKLFLKASYSALRL